MSLSLNRAYKGSLEEWRLHLKSTRIDDKKEPVAFGPMNINVVLKGIDLNGHFSIEDFISYNSVLQRKIEDVALAFNNLAIEVKDATLKTPEGLVKADGEIFLPLADVLSSANGAEMVRGKMAFTMPSGLKNLLIFDVSALLAGWTETGYMAINETEMTLPLEWNKSQITAAGKTFDAKTFFSFMKTVEPKVETKPVEEVAVAANVDIAVEKETKREVAAVEEMAPIKAALEINKLNDRDSTGHTPLVNAILERDFERLELLLSAGADPNGVDRYGLTPLMHAAQRNNLSAIRALILKGAIVELKNARGQTVVDMLRTEKARKLLASLQKPAASETKKEN
jgi:hypothetical protein